MQLLGGPAGNGGTSYRGISESKYKVLVNLYRKVEKLSLDSMPSEVVFSINNKVDSYSQCLQIMQDHKNCD